LLQLRCLGRLVLQHGDDADMADAPPWQSVFQKAIANQQQHANNNPPMVEGHCY